MRNFLFLETLGCVERVLWKIFAALLNCRLSKKLPFVTTFGGKKLTKVYLCLNEKCSDRSETLDVCVLFHSSGETKSKQIFDPESHIRQNWQQNGYKQKLSVRMYSNPTGYTTNLWTILQLQGY